jgi:hypothetical protein
MPRGYIQEFLAGQNSPKEEVEELMIYLGAKLGVLVGEFINYETPAAVLESLSLTRV